MRLYHVIMSGVAVILCRNRTIGDALGQGGTTLKRRFISLFLIIAVLMLGLLPASPALASPDFSKVRVNLEVLGNPKSQTFVINGFYSIAERPDIALEIGRTYTVSNQGGYITISDGSYSTSIGGTKLTFRQSQGGGNIRAGSRSYDGDMQVDVYASGLRMINHVYLETYVKGVVPSEIGNSAPLEAIKAQAIAARSYAVRAMNTRQTAAFDLGDGESSQVYNGLVNAANCDTAVDATRGMVLMYGNEVVSTYYASTNGGYTELARIGVGTSESYFNVDSIVQPDPFDGAYTNPQTYLVRLGFGKDLQTAPITDSRLINLIHQSLSPQLIRQGFRGGFGEYTLTSTMSIGFSKAAAVYNGSDGITRGVDKSGGTTLQTMTTDITFLVSAINASTNNAQAVVMTASLNQGQMVETFRTTSNVRFRMASVQDVGNAYSLTLSRSGHGVGMSQTAAMNRANAGQSYIQILNFYYPLLTIGTVAASQPALPALPASARLLSGAAAPNYTGRTIGTVSINMNVRSTPSTSGSILNVIARGGRVLINSTSGGWHQIAYGNGSGYVSAEYITFGDITTPVPTSGPMAMRVTSTSLVVRSKPESGSSVLTVLGQNDIVQQLSTTGAWSQIQYGTITGYAASAYLVQSSTATPVPTTIPGVTPTPTVTPTIPTATPQFMGRVTSATLTVRASASSTAAALGTLKLGDEVNMLEIGDPWCRIAMGTMTGYVTGQYLELFVPGTQTPRPTSVPTPAPGNSTTKTGTVNATSLNVRNQPSTTATAIAGLKRNDVVTILSTANGWHQIRMANGTTGYVSADFIIVSGGTATPTPVPTSGGTLRTGSVTSQTLNMRSAASTTASSIGTLSKGTAVTVLSTTGAWMQVRLSNGTTGYVAAQYIAITGTTTNPPAATPTPAPTATPAPGGSTKTGTVTASTLNVRSQPSTSASKVAGLVNGNTVTILSTANGWHQIRMANGTTGYVSADFIKDSTPTSSMRVGTVNASSLNVRKTASLTAEVVGRLTQNAYVALTHVAGEWYKVNLGGQVGYVKQEFITLQPTTTTRIATVATDTLPARSAPASSSTTLRTLKKGERFVVLYETGAWAAMDVGGQLAFSAKASLSYN